MTVDNVRLYNPMRKYLIGYINDTLDTKKILAIP